MLDVSPVLKEDHDATSLHSPVWREAEARAVSYGEHTPFFFTRAGAPLLMEGQFRGGPAFLIANGPSLAELDLSPLQCRWAMTLNNGPKTFRGNANCTVDEPTRFSLSIWLDATIQKFVPMSHFEMQLWDNRLLKSGDQWNQQWGPSPLRVGDCPNVVAYRRNERFRAQNFLTEETINWGNHKRFGGGRSVMLAALRILFLLGFRHVYLLGVDFNMSETHKYHFAEDRTRNAIKGNMSTYAKLQQWFAELQPYFLKAGYYVKNCTVNLLATDPL